MESYAIQIAWSVHPLIELECETEREHQHSHNSCVIEH